MNALPHSRRRFLQTTAGLLGAASCSWLPQLATAAGSDPNRKRSCILLWMAGGPTQTDTFDMKPGHANGGEFKETETNVPGLRFSEHFAGLAKQADKLAILRGMSTREGDHLRGTYLMHTGQRPGGPLNYPSIGASLSKAMQDNQSTLPNYVAVNPSGLLSGSALSPGFLGPRYAAATVGTRGAPAAEGSDEMADLGVDFLSLPPGIDTKRQEARLALWKDQQNQFLARHPSGAAEAQATIFQSAVKMMHPDAASAFDLSQESTEVRESYGKGTFGQGCLIARRLVERDVPFVEVTLGGNGLGWDTHQGNFPTVERLSKELDQGWSTLLRELAERDLLETTTICWMGEFGRTPNINGTAGRDHFPDAWTCVLSGGGIAGGQAYGKTDEAGREVTEGKTEVQDLLATLCRAVGVDPATEHYSPQARPIKISEGTSIDQVLA
ncbi:DUF1501 domain-containing protein [Bremerella sp. P1]|uniref:DUF1501 domain-containing protein n=1 Tax=Bremerella sp. P1 TaxID=3026424 RepID=UPI0023682550|nr:DUF1501 domain-containing protein [Bremerella sp. P1]WDI44010.1 DUF1501 domain-containing protein [Bremerella sp. P1]